MNESINPNRHGERRPERCCSAALALPLALLPGCKKAAAPQTQVTVQAEHPEQGPIAEQIAADAILAPIAEAAIAPKITAPVQEVLRPARREGEGRRVAGSRSKTPT